MFSARGKLQELLLRETELTLEKVIAICRTFEITHRQVLQMNPDRMINKVHAKRVAQTQKPKCEKCAAEREEVTIECTYCGYKHKPSKANCPAWDKQCSYCNDRNHFSRKCRKKRGNVCSMDHHNEDSDVEWLQTHGVVQDTTKDETRLA